MVQPSAALVAPGAVAPALRVGWWVLYAAMVTTFVAALPSGLQAYSEPTGLHLPSEAWTVSDLDAALGELGLSEASYAVGSYLTVVALGAIYLVAAALIGQGRSTEPGALLIAAVLAFFAWGVSGTHLALEALYPAWQAPLRALGMISFSCILLLAYVFPDGRFVPRWTRWVALATLVITPLGVLDSPVNPLVWPAWASVPLNLSILIVPLGAQVHRFRRVSTPTQRRQTAWVGLSVAAFLVVSGGLVLLTGLAPGVFAPGARGLLADTTVNVMMTASMALPAIAISIAVLRKRLWDVEPVVMRTLVYGSLIGFTGLLYMATLGGLGALFASPGNLVLSFVAAGIVAVVFAPARAWLQRRIGRLIHGDRDDPYAAMTRLSRRLDNAAAPEAVLTAIVGTVREALRVPQVSIELVAADGRVITTVQDPALAKTTLPPDRFLLRPLVHRGEAVGTLAVARRSADMTVSPDRDRHLLDDLVSHAGAAAHSARASVDLHRARERVVTARQEERRRLRRDLHDGLGPSMAALTMKLDAVEAVIDDDPGQAKELVAETHGEMAELMGTIRHLVYGLWPPTLDQLGLAEALAQHASRQLDSAGIEPILDLPDSIGALPAATEFAAYFIAVEAITNVARHSKAGSCTVRLRRTTTKLEVEVSDDGCWLPPRDRSGLGLHSMTERAAEVGGSCAVKPTPSGGTKVYATLPLGDDQTP